MTRGCYIWEKFNIANHDVKEFHSETDMELTALLIAGMKFIIGKIPIGISFIVVTSCYKVLRISSFP